jgi:hypothetical protein
VRNSGRARERTLTGFRFRLRDARIAQGHGFGFERSQFLSPPEAMGGNGADIPARFIGPLDRRPFRP